MGDAFSKSSSIKSYIFNCIAIEAESKYFSSFEAF